MDNIKSFEHIDKPINTANNNSSYAMRVSEVLKVQFLQARFVQVDTEEATKSRTTQSFDRYRSCKVYPMLTQY